MKKTMICILLVLVFSQAALAAIDIANQFCGSEYTEKILDSNWRKEGDKYCAQASCKNNDSLLERKRCMYQREHANTILVSQSDNFRGKNLAQYKARENTFIVNEGDTCYEECRPVANTFLGIKRKDIFGVERESCRICFANRSDTINDGSYINPVTQQRLYEGQKCHFPCQDKKGDFSKRAISQECVACSGQKFQLLLTKKNNCYELDLEGGIRIIPNHLCSSSKELTLTMYVSRSSFSLSSLIFGAKPECMEVDEETQGALFKNIVDQARCDSNKGIVNSDRSQGKDVDTKTNSKKASGGQTTQQ